jgi:Holliday junction DNA helicase RuvB
MTERPFRPHPKPEPRPKGGTSSVERPKPARLTQDAAFEIARRSRGTPRIANALLRRVRDFAQIKGDGTIEINITQMSLNALNVDTLGLDEMDNKILMTMMNKFNGGPVGLTTIATAVGEDAGTIEEVYEPFLIQEGFLTRTPRGRQLTDLTYKHLGKIRNNPGELF